MKSTGIMFKPEMVRALLNGLKTQTRRVTSELKTINECPDRWVYSGQIFEDKPDVHGLYSAWEPSMHGVKSRYGVAGDQLCVRETSIIAPKRFQGPDDDDLCNARDVDGDPRMVQYLATHDDTEAAGWYGLKKTPSILMPRWASRIHLEIESVTVERLHDITEADARAEGMHLERTTNGKELGWQYKPGDAPFFDTARDAYLAYYDIINGKGSSAANPWVFVIKFKKLEVQK